MWFCNAVRLVAYGTPSSVLVPVATHDSRCGCSRTRVLTTQREVSKQDPNHAGVLEYAREDGAVASLFKAFCKDNLCMDSWEFIVDAAAYEV